MGNTGENIMAENAMWTFSGDVPKAFSQHVKKSVPLYFEGQDLVVDVSEFFVAPESLVYDLGCSVGTLSAMLADRHSSKNVKVVGIDIEKDMIEEAKKSNLRENIEFFVDDIITMELEKTNFICCYYTIQFISPSVRQVVYQKIFDALQWGGGLVLFEKVRSPDARFQDYITQLYNEFKLKQGYSSDNIVAKSRSLKEFWSRFHLKEILTY